MYPKMNSRLSLSCFCIHAITLVLCCCSFLQVPSAASNGNDTDRLALLHFKAKLNDPTGSLSSWINGSLHFCKWYGVTCGHRHQRVTVLYLKSLKLSGSISPHIGNLSFLRILNLVNNSLTGEIPPQIGRLRRLQMLHLYNNSIGGQIPPTLSNCSNIVFFHFGNNRLEGAIPVELGSLSLVNKISLSMNLLTGIIPPSLGNMSLLVVFYALRNNLIGNLPASFGQLKNLAELSVTDNRLHGAIPPSIFNLSTLTLFDVGINSFEGSIPSGLDISLPNLTFFSLGMNRFTGSIPASISNMSNLEVLELPANGFTGRVPSFEKLHRLRVLVLSRNNLGSGESDDLNFISSLTNATGLQVLQIIFNNFGGKLPDQISNFSRSLWLFSFGDNHIHGTIPVQIENLVSLRSFYASNNELTGTIPSGISKLSNLHELKLGNNNFFGYIPFSLGNLTNLISLYVGYNILQGNIPSSLEHCQNLLALDFSRNNLSGTIPPQVISLFSLLIYLDLSHNHFTGVLPMEVEKLRNLGFLDVSNNNLSGEIPSGFASCTSLEFLTLASNLFQGSIPIELISLRGLRELDLSKNNLSGEIPNFLKDFTLLEILNLSYNNLEGAVPMKGVFLNASATSVMGNSKLCGGIPEFKLPKCNYGKPKRRLTLRMKIIISTVSTLLGVSLVIFSLYFYLSRKKRESENSSGLSSFENSLLKVSYQSLLKATDGFSSANLLGAGSFGSVYKGNLDQQGMVIAVKVLNLMRQGASKTFMVECEALRSIRHRNLVKVLTACSGIDYQGNGFKALVYEFMVNGNLDQWLHPTLTSAETPRKLSLLQRLNIAIDVACALEYLHHHCETPIVHCDLKPSNVLLDDEMTAHVGDFGLAKLLFQEGSINHSTNNQSSSIGVRGTIGYAPPEYGVGSEMSIHGDMYSFGILLLEMFIGKRPTDEMFRDGLNLHSFVKTALPDQVIQVADMTLLDAVTDNGGISSKTKDDYKILECLISTFEVGISCSAESPGERMNSIGVVAQLCKIRNKLVGK